MLPSRGWGPWRQEFYSYHSDPDRLMEAGDWRNVWLSSISSFVFRHHPMFWLWWNNLPFIKRLWLRNLQKHFPNLR